jgi:hypothetical protein
MVQRTPDSVVRATIAGRFFAAHGDRGYGHFGCCNLLAIERVVAVEPQDNSTLDLRASPDQPDIAELASIRFLVPDGIETKLISAQHKAEVSKLEWPFADPARVATEGIAGYLGIDGASVTGIRPVKSTQGRIIYEWRPKGKNAWYMVVVSRPYWMSFYSRDPKRVAWAVIAAYEAIPDQS